MMFCLSNRYIDYYTFIHNDKHIRNEIGAPKHTYPYSQTEPIRRPISALAMQQQHDIGNLHECLRNHRVRFTSGNKPAVSLTMSSKHKGPQNVVITAL